MTVFYMPKGKKEWIRGPNSVVSHMKGDDIESEFRRKLYGVKWSAKYRLVFKARRSRSAMGGRFDLLLAADSQ